MDHTKRPSPIVLITGSAIRIGHEIAIYLADHGWDVAIHYHHNKQAAYDTQAKILQKGRRAICLQADLSSEAQTSTLISRCVDQLGLPQLLVNNASVFEYDHATTFSYDFFRKHQMVNVAAPLCLAKTLFDVTPHDAQGLVVNLLDQKLANLNPDFFSYTLSKSALETATMMLAQSFAPRLRVMGVAPGITLISGSQSQEDFQKSHQVTPLGRSSTPTDIAQTILFLSQNRAMTGSVVWVDGGQHLMGLPRDVAFIPK